MIRTIRIAVAVAVVAVVGLMGLDLAPASAAPLLPPPSPSTPPAVGPAADGTYTVRVNTKGAHYHFRLCIKSDTVKKRPRGDGSDRHCIDKTWGGKVVSLTTDYVDGDSVYMDVEMFTGLTGESVTMDNVNITGARTCDLSGLVHAGKFRCDTPDRKVAFEPPDIEAYTIDSNPKKSISSLLNLMAWMVSAAAVGGLLLTGATMASQVRRGALEERPEIAKHLALIFAACLIATTAGPFVQWLALTD